MEYEWDEQKNQYNQAKHNVSFCLLGGANWYEALIIPDLRCDYGEERLLAYLPINHRLYAVIYTSRNSVRRIISLKKANPREVKTYEQNFR